MPPILQQAWAINDNNAKLQTLSSRQLSTVAALGLLVISNASLTASDNVYTWICVYMCYALRPWDGRLVATRVNGLECLGLGRMVLGSASSALWCAAPVNRATSECVEHLYGVGSVCSVCSVYN